MNLLGSSVRERWRGGGQTAAVADAEGSRRGVHIAVLGAGVVVALGLVAVIAQVFVPEKSRVDRLQAPEGITRVVINVGSGPVSVTGAARGRVEVNRTRKWRVGEPKVSAVAKGDTYTVTGRCGSGFVVSLCSLKHEVAVPPDVAVEVHAGSGRITVQGLRGEAVLETGSGRIVLSDLRNSITARTGSGTIDLDAITGGRVNARTGSGDIRGTNLDVGAVVARTGSGAVSLAFTAPVDSLDVETGSGDIELELVPIGYAVDADAGSGRIRVEVRQDPSSRRAVRAHTGSGDVTIRPAPATAQR
jgi:hypothetical protein